MDKSDCDKVKLQFTRNTDIFCNRSKALMTMDPYNSLRSDINKDLFGSGDAMVGIDN